MSACSKGQEWQAGLELMSGMMDRRLAVQGITQSVVIGMCRLSAFGASDSFRVAFGLTLSFIIA